MPRPRTRASSPITSRGRHAAATPWRSSATGPVSSSSGTAGAPAGATRASRTPRTPTPRTRSPRPTASACSGGAVAEQAPDRRQQGEEKLLDAVGRAREREVVQVLAADDGHVQEVRAALLVRLAVLGEAVHRLQEALVRSRRDEVDD